MGRNRNPGSDEAGSLFGRDQAGSLFARLRGWSPFSRTKRDISAARQAELRGDLPKAAALFGRAGANDQVARIMILRAESEPDPKLRLQHYVQAASIAPTEDPVKKIAQIRRAQMMTLIVKGGALSAASRADLLAAARDLEELGEASEAAAAYQLAGDHESEARALAAAGNIEELETLLERDQAKTRQVRNQQTKLEEIDLASMTGRRREALALAEELGEVPDEITPEAADTPKVREIKLELMDRIATYQEGWREVEACGAVVKDTRMGLIDFYGRVEDKLVWLCWKYGEEECGYYHALNEGFSGRRGIGASVRQRLLN